MQLIKLKPRTPGTRHSIKIDKSLLLKNNFLFKNLITQNHFFKGRSKSTGHITVRHKGSGCKKKYRSINFYNEAKTSIIVALCYDPNRTNFIALNFNFLTLKFNATPSLTQLYTGFIYSCRKNLEFLKLGYRTHLKSIPAGSVISNLSLTCNSFSKYSRSAGTACQIVQKTDVSSKVRLPSGKIINISNDSFATLGGNANISHNLISLGKAGKSRLKGIRPTVRGIAMNPIDHPHGGRTNSGFVYVTPWGIPTKGVKTKKK